MNHRLIYFLLIILIISGILFRVVSLNKDFSSEEPDFIKSAIAIKNTGHPVIYNSERTPRVIGLWHPPMYIYLMAIIFKFNISEISARSINVTFSMLTALLIFLFCTKIIKGRNGNIIGLISVSFFLINYYILSSSTMIDIDILSSFFIFGFVFLIILYNQEKKGIYLFLSSLFLFFSLWNRYPMALLTYFFIGIYFFLNKDLRKEFKNYFYVGFFAFLSFILIWSVYSIIIQPGTFFYFIKHNSELGKEQFSSLFIYLGSFILNISQFIRLITFPVIILLISSLVFFVKKRNKEITFLLLYILPILIFFIILPRPAFGYPRYFMTIMPGISILISIFIYKNLNKKLDKKEKIIIILSFFISLLLLILLNPQGTYYEDRGLIKATNLPDFLINLFASIPLIFVFLARNNKKRVAILIIIGLTLSYNLYFDAKFIRNNLPIKEVGEYIKNHTNNDEIILAPKDVAFYAERRYYINANNKPKIDLSLNYFLEYFKKSYEDKEMEDPFFWPEGIYSGLYAPFPSQEELNKVVYVVTIHPIKEKEVEKRIANFYIYNIKNN